MTRLLGTYLMFMLALSSVAHAQLDSLPDSLRRDRNGTRADTTEPGFKITPWKYNSSVNSTLVTTDSLMRWQIWPNWTYKKNRDPGVFSYRLGTTGRTSALLIDAHESRHQELSWEDIPLNDPVSGTIDWNLIPHHKIDALYEENEGVTHETNFYLKQYYVNKPVTRLLFDESKFDMRGLEFLLARNFSQKTNLEISYQDRRDGGGYPNSSFQGRQIFSRFYYQADNQQLFKVKFLNDVQDLEEPFGYVIPDLNTFNFNRFTVSANELSANSESGLTTIALSYHRRGADTTAVPEQFRSSVFYNSRKREVNYSIDSTLYKVQSIGGSVNKWIDLNRLRIEGSLLMEQFINKDRSESNLNTGNWNVVEAGLESRYRIISDLGISGGITFRRRNDGFEDLNVRAGLYFGSEKGLRVDAGASKGTLMPTPQQLYWNSIEFSGNQVLTGESIEEAHLDLEYRFRNSITLGAKAQLKQVEDGIFLSGNNNFVNANEYRSISSTGYFDYSSTHFVFSGSATVHRFDGFNPGPLGLLPSFNSDRIWMKGSAYWKGYLFNRATYVKAGLAGVWAPQRYLASSYNTVLDFWQPSSSDQLIPSFSRLDVDLSARVRSIMFVVRYENVLDEVNQLGYFETAGYPMPPRRFIFGVRVLFRN